MITAEVTDADTPMNWSHRCDRCGARACTEVITHGGLLLLFCAHDYITHAAALARTAHHVIRHPIEG